MTEPSTISEIIDAGRSWDAYWAYLILNNSYSSLVYDKEDVRKTETKNLASSAPPVFYSTELIHTISGLPASVAGVYAHGSEIVNKKVVEIGSGLGIASRGLAFNAKRYLGIEASKMAVHITNNMASSNMRFYHVSQTRELSDVRGGFDTAVAANVFMHQNASHALATLQMASRLLKKGGVLRGNFSNLNPVEFKAGTKYASDKLDISGVTHCYWFEDAEINAIADEAGFIIEEIEVYKPHNNKYVKLVKK